MRLLNYFISIAIVSIFLACGTISIINTTEEFDLWDYMTSYRNYEVEYQFFHNGYSFGKRVEQHILNGNQYTIFHNNGTTTQLLTNGKNILKIAPDGVETDIERYVYLGDRHIFQSTKIKLCSFDRFYRDYKIYNSKFYNVIEITCRSRSGIYQEFYYGYNEGLVAFYQDDGVNIDELVKISESPI